MKKAATLVLFLALAQIPAFCESSERLNVYYNNGVVYFKDGKYSSAILEFKKVLRQRPYDKTVRYALSDVYLARAKYYNDKEKAYRKAINDYRSALTYLKYWDDEDQSKISVIQGAEYNLNALKKSYAPLKTPEAVLTEAKNLRAQGELAASIYELRQLFNNSKYQNEAYQTASDIYKSLNNEKEAVETVRTALNMTPDNGILHLKYAILLDDFGNEDAAMDEYSKALEYSNNNPEVLSALEKLWMARSVQNPKDSQALINLGAILQKENRLELAKAQYIKARQINPNDPVVLINLASVMTAMNDYDGALKVYDEILLKNKGDLSARLYKGKLYEKKGDIPSAIKQYKEILSIKKDDETAQNALNSVLSNLSGDKLEEYLKKEADTNPTNYDAQFKYAFEMHKNKKYEGAITYYKKAIAINPKKPEPFINLAQIFILQNDMARAKNVVAHGLSNLPDNQNLKELEDSINKQGANELYAKGSELYNSGNYQGALEYYSKISYQTPEINMMIGNCYFELKQNDKALEFYQKALSQDSKNESVMLMASNTLSAMGRDEDAKEYLNKILSINPNNKNAKDTLSAINQNQESELLNGGIELYENKKYDDALLLFDKLIAKNPKNAYAFYYKGAIYEEKQMPDKALEEYKKSIAADSNFALSYYMTAVLYDTKEDYKQAITYYDKYVQLKTKEGVDDEFTKYAKSRGKELKDYLSKNK